MHLKNSKNLRDKKKKDNTITTSCTNYARVKSVYIFKLMKRVQSINLLTIGLKTSILSLKIVSKSITFFFKMKFLVINRNHLLHGEVT